MSGDSQPARLDPASDADLAGAVRDLHRSAFGDPADMSSATPPVVGCAIAPGRVNLIGEHTDHQGGPCLPVALPYATAAAVTLRADGVLRLVSAQSDDGWEGRLGDVGPGEPSGWTGYAAGVLASLRAAGWPVVGADVAVDGRVPLGGGLSSSAALECSVGSATAAALHRPLDDPTRRALVSAGVRAEGEVVGAPTGGMDQTVAMHGREGCALLVDFRDGSHRAVPFDPGPAGLTLLVIDTRVSHDLADGGYGDRRGECARASEALGVDLLAEVTDLDAVEALEDDLLRRRARHIVTEVARVDACVTALEDGDWDRVGELMRQSHASMRDDFEISCEELDVLVDTAVGHTGTLGARMTGGGFGGSAVALVRDAAVDDVVDAVLAAFEERGWDEPAVLLGTPSPGARLV